MRRIKPGPSALKAKAHCLVPTPLVALDLPARATRRRAPKRGIDNRGKGARHPIARAPGL